MSFARYCLLLALLMWAMPLRAGAAPTPVLVIKDNLYQLGDLSLTHARASIVTANHHGDLIVLVKGETRERQKETWALIHIKGQEQRLIAKEYDDCPAKDAVLHSVVDEKSTQINKQGHVLLAFRLAESTRDGNFQCLCVWDGASLHQLADTTSDSMPVPSELNSSSLLANGDVVSMDYSGVFLRAAGTYEPSMVSPEASFQHAIRTDGQFVIGRAGTEESSDIIAVDVASDDSRQPLVSRIPVSGVKDRPVFTGTEKAKKGQFLSGSANSGFSLDDDETLSLFDAEKQKVFVVARPGLIPKLNGYFRKAQSAVIEPTGAVIAAVEFSPREQPDETWSTVLRWEGDECSEIAPRMSPTEGHGYITLDVLPDATTVGSRWTFAYDGDVAEVFVLKNGKCLPVVKSGVNVAGLRYPAFRLDDWNRHVGYIQSAGNVPPIRSTNEKRLTILKLFAGQKPSAR